MHIEKKVVPLPNEITKHPMAYIHTYNIVTPLGHNLQHTLAELLRGKSAIAPHQGYGQLEPIPLSVVPTQPLQQHYHAHYQQPATKLEQMLLLCASPLIEAITVTKRTALVLSTTKGNITDLSNPHTQPLPFLSDLAHTLAHRLGITTQPIVLSNACVSGAMALSVADRLLEGGIYDSALVLAGDVVSEFVLSGFASFQALSAQPCKPYDAHRDGITLGEAAAAVYLTRNPQGASAKILGSSSINDANHISGPSRTGEGLYQSVQNAMRQANITHEALALINAHGTGTLYNDEMESIAFARAGLTHVPLNSYKGYFGHTLGASGLLETVLTAALLRQGLLLKSIGFETLGVSEPINVLTTTQKTNRRHFLKTASGFGGSNTALVLEVSSQRSESKE
ncbi:3-oxoacyl-[acyl-carrier-protein] synthase-1 [Capnocytophaga haemolytica]|uniref:3-oxoacyl-[acyl-carrier-protein] synthase 1 n=2 Tax=Capnocytophaga haemolytica TaxID=45243 RepID=A0AAX2GWN0_9FLAO|nr:3-oxoacyl-[acyl-carrier-protein] synthase-1 [Capnocytophaga haemolytica]SNV07197.1 3-oxoacyl-[acyl-carrier-protein] synthase 1 [Capnocytophaga haemolytica]